MYPRLLSYLVVVVLMLRRIVSQLRDIEILAQQQIETLEAEGKDDETLREIQKILYSTEVLIFIFFRFCATRNGFLTEKLSPLGLTGRVRGS